MIQAEDVENFILLTAAYLCGHWHCRFAIRYNPKSAQFQYVPPYHVLPHPASEPFVCRGSFLCPCTRLVFQAKQRFAILVPDAHFTSFSKSGGRMGLTPRHSTCQLYCVGYSRCQRLVSPRSPHDLTDNCIITYFRIICESMSHAKRSCRVNRVFRTR